MRPLALAIALLLLPLVPATPAGAQAAGGHLLTDDKGDTVLATGAGPGAPLSGNALADGADLLSLDIAEDVDAFTLTLAVASLAPPAAGQVQDEYEIRFSWRDMEYDVDAYHAAGTLYGYDGAELFASDGADYERVAPIPMTLDAAKGTITLPVQKIFVLDGSKHPPGRGDAIRNVHVTARQSVIGDFSFFGGPGPSSVTDAMPNSGDGPNLAFQLGNVAQGHLALTSNDPVRVSNGGATTFVFQTTVHNNASYDDEIDLKIVDLPPQWNGTVESPVRVPAGATKSLAVLVSVPFAHVHGGFSSFNLTATTRKDAGSLATLRLGVLHTPIPQPAGHHSEIYLHGRNANSGVFSTLFPYANGFINTEAAHDGDVDVDSNGYGSGDGGSVLMWTLPLNPGLRLGIDMDLNRTGLLEGSVVGKTQGTGTVSAKLLLVKDKGAANQARRASGDQGILIGEAKPAKVALDLQKPSAFKTVVVPLDGGDYVPYEPGQNLVLVVRLALDQEDPCCLGPLNTPTLTAKDFKMTLPLNEYNDRIAGVADVASGLDLKPESPLEKIGRPGTIMTYQMTLSNGGGSEATVQLDVAGNDAKLGTLVPQGRVTLGPRETHRVTLAVHIPGDAPTGKDLEVIVFAHAQDDPGKMAIARTRTTVSTGANATDDESGVLVAAREAEHKSPGVGLLGVVVGVAALALAIRTRRAKK